MESEIIGMMRGEWGEMRVDGLHFQYGRYQAKIKDINILDVTFCILYFSSNSCSTCFGQPRAHHQKLTTA